MKMEWFTTALVSMLAFSVLFLLYRKIADLGIKSEVAFLYYFIFSAIFLLIYLLITKNPLGISKIPLIFILIAALVGVMGNVLLYISLGNVPNPGYTLAIVGLNALVVAIASIFIFKAEFPLIKIIGTILAIVGVILLSLK